MGRGSGEESHKKNLWSCPFCGIYLMMLNKSTVVKTSSSHRWGPCLNPRSNQIYSVLMQWNWLVETMDVGSRVYVMVTSAGSCWTGEIEGVGAVELVCVYRLLRMASESILLPVWRSVGGGFTGKGEQDARKLHVMGAGWAGMGSGSTSGICPVHLLDGRGLVSGYRGAEKTVGSSVGKEKRIQS